MASLRPARSLRDACREGSSQRADTGSPLERTSQGPPLESFEAVDVHTERAAATFDDHLDERYPNTLVVEPAYHGRSRSGFVLDGTRG